LNNGFILMLQIDCTWGVVVHKKSRRWGVLSLAAIGHEIMRRSQRRLRKKWILFWTIYLQCIYWYNL